MTMPEKLTNGVDPKKGSFQKERVKSLSFKQEEATVSLPRHHFSGANCWFSRGVRCDYPGESIWKDCLTETQNRP